MNKMSITSWHRCFLCSVPLTKGSDRANNGHPTSDSALTKLLRENPIHKLLFQYLLNEFQPKPSDTLYQDILTFAHNVEDAAPSPRIQFCNFCDQLSKTVRDLHLQLEVIQMKIIEKIKAAKQVVIQNSRLYGSNQSVKEDLEAFEQHLDNQEELELRSGSGSITGDIGRERKFLEVLHMFQMQVFEKGDTTTITQHYPLVYLQRYTGSCVNEAVSGSDNISFSCENTLIKKEPSDDGASDGEATGGLHYTDDDIDIEYGATFADGEVDREGAEKETFKSEEEIEKPGPKPSHNNNGIKKVQKRKKPPLVVKKTFPSRGRSSKRLQKIKAVKEEVKRIARHSLEAEATPEEPLTEAQKIATEMRLQRKKSAISQLKETLKTLVRVKDKGKRPKGRIRGERKNQYSCEEDDCSFQCDKTPRMEQHLREHETSEKNLKCPDCKKEFSKKQYWNFHIYIYCGSRKWKCDVDVCNQTIDGGKLKEHYDKNHNGKFYTCEFCDYYFGTYQAFLKHTVYHPGTNYKCVYCSPEDCLKRYTRLDLFRHLHEAHNQTDNMVVCDYPNCSKVYYTLPALNTHKQTHEPITPSCHICGKTYSLKSHVEAHISYAHKKDGPYKCDICFEIFLCGETLKSHKRQKHGLGKLKCKLCPDKEYSSSRGLTVHMMEVHGDDETRNVFPCETCGKEFSTVARLERHQPVHIEEKNYICETCGFKTKSLLWLKKHKRQTHDGPKRHECSYCPKKFRVPAHLKEHIRTHTGEKPFICEKCGQAFSQQGSLILHKKKKHPQQGTFPPPASYSSSSSMSADVADEFKVFPN